VSPWYFDRSYIRNAFAYELGRRLGHWAPRTRLAEMWLNTDGGRLDQNDYHGIVVLTDRVRFGPDRVAIDPVAGDAEGEPEVSGGYLLKIDSRDADEYGFHTSRGIPLVPGSEFVVYRPKAADLPDAQRDYIRGYVQDMEDALYADRASNFATRRYLDYIDLPSWVDLHLLNVFLGNPDAFWRSTYFYKPREQPLVAGPLWDFDRSSGSADPRVERWDRWALAGPSGEINVWEHEWWGELSRDPEFMQAWIDRWQTLRRNRLRDVDLHGLIDTLAAEIDPDAAARDAARWPDNASRFGNGFLGEVAHLADWMTKRAGWIDAQFVHPPSLTLVEDGFVLTPAPGTVTVYTIDGSHPRASGGERAPEARSTEGPVRLSAVTALRARSPAADSIATFPGSPSSSEVSPAALQGQAEMIDLSSRAYTGSGQDVLIAGFHVAGSEPRRIPIRAVGPALVRHSVKEHLPNPPL